MRKAGLFIPLILSVCWISAQPYSTGHTTITFTDPARNNRQVPTEIYYPALSTGDDVPVATTGGKFPVISFGHGFLMSWDAYENIWNMLVPSGYIVALPKTEGTASPSHAAFAADLAFVIHSVTALSNNNVSIFYDRVDTMSCLMGHSMGGGAALLAAANNNQIKATATLAPAETNPSAIQASGSVSAPSLVIAGGNDCVTPISTNQQPMYENLSSPCKIFLEINGASHCQMADNNFICSIGESTCQPAPAISPSVQHTVIRRYLLPWLDFHLKGICSSGTEIENLLPSDPQISFRKDCTLCLTTGEDNTSKNLTPSIFPNPVNDVFFIQLPGSQINNQLKTDLFSAEGKCISTFISTPVGIMIKVELPKNMTPGTYIIRMTEDKLHYIARFIKGL